MEGFLQTALSFPTVLFSFLLILAIIYWGIVALGMVEIDVLDLDAESVVDGAGQAEGLAALLAKLKLNGVPVTLVLTLLSFFAWFLCYFVQLWLLSALPLGWLRYPLGAVVAVGALLSFMCRPDFPMSAPILLSAHHRAMHALYSEHHGWLQNWLRGKLGCAADAADLAQDTFLRILLKRELREIGMPRAFLRTIARGLVIDHWRREELQRAYLESIAHLPEAQAPSPEARELVLELLEEISRMLDGLKPKVRTAFLLAQCEDLSHRQIAERMGVSQRSVERYVAEALYHCYLLRYGE